MSKSWASFEDRVRDIAQFLWGRPCSPKRIGGVNIDGVAEFDNEISMLVEITEERKLDKVRGDIIKLQTAKNAMAATGNFARCFCIIDGQPTQAMLDAASHVHINVLSIDQFTRMFFDFSEYRIARSKAPFGSSINPLTGESDDTEYVSVRYSVDGRKNDVTSKDIAGWIRDGKRIILLGEYGSGKSRCVREVFRHLTDGADASFCYPLAIDLRRSWGLERGHELIRRHMTELGLAGRAENAAIKAFNVGAFAILLDGFDEIGSQAWSNDGARLKAIRAKSLSGVKDLVRQSSGGVLITGREHYFPSVDEMYSALGFDKNNTIIVRSKDEFSDTELLEYFEKRDIDVDVPPWLPRRPLICQTISDLAAGDFAAMFGEEGDEIAFWEHFLHVLCERDARIHVSFDPDTIFRLFIQLARVTRSKPANVGPLSLAELQGAFEAVTGSAPVEEASVMLQRLPSLGRISPESNDRQFVDIYILDGLRAKDVVHSCLGSDDEFSAAANARWNNPLDDLGQRVLANDVSLGLKSKLQFCRKALVGGNKVLASDLVASMVRQGSESCDFEGMEIDNGDFLYFTLSEREIKNLTIVKSYFGELSMPPKGAVSVSIINSVAPRVSGISAATALPSWVKGLEVEHFDSVESVSRIRKIGLGPAHEILITIIRKTFFQKGRGRKEEALLRGLGNVAARAMSTKVLNLMMKDGLLTSFKGDEGTVYAPVRSHTKRMQAILDDLKGSTDELWKKVGEL